jgi:hypothetical protein
MKRKIRHKNRHQHPIQAGLFLFFITITPVVFMKTNPDSSYTLGENFDLSPKNQHHPVVGHSVNTMTLSMQPQVTK